MTETLLMKNPETQEDRNEKQLKIMEATDAAEKALTLARERQENLPENIKYTENIDDNGKHTREVRYESEWEPSTITAVTEKDTPGIVHYTKDFDGETQYKWSTGSEEIKEHREPHYAVPPEDRDLMTDRSLDMNGIDNAIAVLSIDVESLQKKTPSQQVARKRGKSILTALKGLGRGRRT